MEKKTATSNEYGEHGSVKEDGSVEGSVELQNVFKQRPWQIQDPEKAKIIFLSLDANWDKDIEDNKQFFDETKTYLEDGVKYVENNWKKNNVHTPMLKDFYNGDGKPYHRRLRDLFQELSFTPDDVKNVCLLELLNVCTYGGSQKRENKGKYKKMLMDMWNNTTNDPKNKEHKERIQKVFESENNIICIPRTVKTYINNLKLGLNLSRKNIILHYHFSYFYCSAAELREDREKLKNGLRIFLDKK